MLMFGGCSLNGSRQSLIVVRNRNKDQGLYMVGDKQEQIRERLTARRTMKVDKFTFPEFGQQQ